MIRVLIADDHAILRGGLKDILIRGIEHVMCGEAENAEQALGMIRAESWELIILDITMPGRSGLDILKEVHGLRPKLPVLVLSVHPEDQYGRRVLKAGASGYMNKETAPEELLKAVRKLLVGGHYLSPRLAESLLVDLKARDEEVLHERLSDREFEVLCKIAAGKTVSEIAEQLQLSVATISTYRARLLEKMGLSTTVELIHYGIQYHLVE